jgi:excisionase family DNA binding protein
MVAQDISKIMTVPEESAYLRVHPSTIYKMVRRHELPAFRIGSDWRFELDAMERWRRAGGTKTIPPV